MKVRSCIGGEVCICLPKYAVIFLSLAVAVLIYVLRNMEVLEFQHRVISTIMVPRVSTVPDMHHSFCTFQPLSPEDALEERLLLDSIAWPETPLLTAPLSLEQTSDPAHSTFTILPPGRGGGQWHVGDQLEVFIKMYDFQGHPKKSGGDFLLARLHNPTLGAGQPEVESSIVKSELTGYYYQGVWRALGGTTVHQFNPSAITQCLKGKVVHMYGDSTIRQWYEYLIAVLPDLKDFNLHGPLKAGPYMALDYANNILVTYRCHGVPIRFRTLSTRELRYIANELDGLSGGPNTVVALSIWAHFTSFPMEVYIRRLQSIRRAVVRLLDRAPGTVVIIRTGNPRALTLTVALTNSDWYSLQCDKVLKAMFRGLNVHLVDAWGMTVAHHLPHDIHPPPPIIRNMIDVVMSYTCPQKGG